MLKRKIESSGVKLLLEGEDHFQVYIGKKSQKWRDESAIDHLKKRVLL